MGFVVSPGFFSVCAFSVGWLFIFSLHIFRRMRFSVCVCNAHTQCIRSLAYMNFPYSLVSLEVVVVAFQAYVFISFATQSRIFLV